MIVQDMGYFYIREHFPDLPVHASTDDDYRTGGRGAYDEDGRGRIVTARELSLEEIRRIYQETGVEIESFVHWALSVTVIRDNACSAA
ncbi:MAG: U32 family peptidase [Clostridium fessum]